MDLNYKESRQARIERTLAGTGPLWQVGKLLTAVKDGKTLAQRLAEGEEIGRDALNFPHALPEQFSLSLQSICLWGCPFCGSAHGSGVGVSRSVNIAALEGNQFYYNPLTRQLFTISATCLRKQPELWERFTDSPMQHASKDSSPETDHQTVSGNYPRSGWIRRSIALVVACYCGIVVYSRFLLRGKNS